MSDYLNNLVARTLNLTPAVQPRLASLFEASAVAGGNAGSFEASVAGGNAGSFEASVAGGIADSFELETERDGITKREPPRQTSPLVPAPAPLGPSRTPITVEPGESVVGPKHRPASESFELRDETKEQAIPRVSALVESPLRSWPMPPPSEPPVSNAAIYALIQPTTAAPNAQTDSARVQLPASGIPPRSEPAAAPQPLRPSIPAIIVRQPNTLPVIPARRVHNETAAAVESPATISVTIGRVDVRAIFPQPPGPRASHGREHSAMSLDDYLKRNEGRR
jgi:hypothetical protein